jgi:hypothetical protein
MAAFLDGCRFNPTAGGTSDWTYSSAVTGYQGPAAANIANGRLYKYRAESADLSQWEFGEGAYSTTTGVLARTIILYNSSGTNAKINFSTVPQVAIVALKEDLISVEEANSFTTAQKQQACGNIGVTAIGQASVGQIPGTSGTTQPAAGFVGELISSGDTSGSFSATGVVNNIALITVTPGVWDLEAINNFAGAGATFSSDWTTGINLANNTLIGNVRGCHTRSPSAQDYAVLHMLPRTRVAVTSNSTYYLNASAVFSGSQYGWQARIEARRVS